MESVIKIECSDSTIGTISWTLPLDLQRGMAIVAEKHPGSEKVVQQMLEDILHGTALTILGLTKTGNHIGYLFKKYHEHMADFNRWVLDFLHNAAREE